jgi:hypothetical protein
MTAEERAIAHYLTLVPKPEPDEFDDVLDTSDIIDAHALVLEQSGEVEIEVHVSEATLPELEDLFGSSASEWDDNPTREIQLRPRVTHESGLFRRFEADNSVLDAAVFVTELKRRHTALHGRIRRLENVRLELVQHPSARAAWGTLSGRFVEVGRLVTALGAAVRISTERGALELFAPSRPLAAYLRAGFDYAEAITGALAMLGQELTQRRPDWDAFYERVNDARSWLVPELFEEVRADLALMALQIGEKPVAHVTGELRKTALAQSDVEAVLTDWLG